MRGGRVHGKVMGKKALKILGGPTKQKATPAGFEPARGDPIGLAGRRLNHSAKVSMIEALCYVRVAL